MKEYYFKNKEFVIEQYDKQKTFSSFLPGLAGKRGIPLWAFYVNRGQGIASFGLQDKNGQILEFKPAVTSYQMTPLNGFRTFIKTDDRVFEMFGETTKKSNREMRISRSEFTIVEYNETLGLQMNVTYFGLPNENIAALVRKVEFHNIAKERISFDALDGLAQLFPYQIENVAFHAVGNLLRSWMEVYHLDKDLGYYRMRSSSSDSAEVVETKRGNFYLSSIDGTAIRPIVDESLVFGYDKSKRFAKTFENTSLEELKAKDQVTANKIPVGFSPVSLSLAPGESKTMYTVIGHTHSEEHLFELKDKLIDPTYLATKQQEASDVIATILADVDMKSNFPIFDDYIKQNYLDNILRGGYPLIIEGDDKHFVYHLFSRRHGDLERDYNFFSIAPEFYSQGNGSFRDVCQNRRNDVLFNPNVRDFNMKMFASFIQADGYNPLSIDGSSFEIDDFSVIDSLVNDLFDNSPIMKNVLQSKFTPGSIINTMHNHGIESSLSDEEIFAQIFAHASQNFEAHFAEGYWIDHWTYILDLVETYEAVYPDLIQDALYEPEKYSYFESTATVLPRNEKICLLDNGDVRRYGSIIHFDEEKATRLGMKENKAFWLQDQNKNELKTSLFGKLFLLAVNKITHIDPSGMGLEMEAEKPGWNDAMNGLPGLFGSGVSEMIELKRLVDYLIHHFDSNHDTMLPQEFIGLVMKMNEVFKDDTDDFTFWDQMNTIKETYRAEIRFGSAGNGQLSASIVKKALQNIQQKAQSALDKAYDFGDGIYPTYLVHEVTDYKKNMDKDHMKIGQHGLPTVSPKAFSVRALPNYLEAPARALKVMNDFSQKKSMFEKIKESNIYDHELKFYKTSEFLDDESNEIGRGRSFTKGWQERESNFLHMTYKYLLGLLKGGLYDEYYEEIKTNLTCFMDPEVYGRSTLENSSFIAPSINPDKDVRGQGFVARLSGSTAEMLSMWNMMMVGKHPFTVEDDELVLNLKPMLHKSFFENNELSFTFLGHTLITYINESNCNSYDEAFHIKSYKLDEKEVNSVKGELAKQVRNGAFKHITITF